MRFAMVAALAAACVCAPAQAAVTVNFTQVGADVVATTTGSLNQTGLTLLGYGNFSGVAQGNGPAIVGTGFDSRARAYSGFTGPSSFGTGTATIYASSSEFFSFGVRSDQNGVTVYTSHEGNVFGSAIFLNRTFASLGLTPGTYIFSSSADHIFINIGPSVPEPATWAIMLLGFGAMGAALRRSRSVSFA